MVLTGPDVSRSGIAAGSGSKCCRSFNVWLTAVKVATRRQRQRASLDHANDVDTNLTCPLDVCSTPLSLSKDEHCSVAGSLHSHHQLASETHRYDGHATKSSDDYRVRQIYKNISMLCLFPATINLLLSCCLAYTACTRPVYTAVFTTHTRPCNSRVHGP